MSPVKETNFFAFEDHISSRRRDKSILTEEFPATTLAAYEALFSRVRAEKAIGEASPRYLSTGRAPERMRRLIPDVKLIAMLRDPAERAYSSYLFHSVKLLEKRTFSQAIADERRDGIGLSLEEWTGGWPCYLLPGFYYQHLRRYLKVFDRTQLAVYLLDDLRSEPQKLIQEIFRYLGVDPTFIPELSAHHNVSALPRNKLLRFLVRPTGLSVAFKRRLPDRLRRPVHRYALRFVYGGAMKLRARHRVEAVPDLSAEIREMLIALYRDDILQLQDFLQRDLAKWLE